MATTLRYCPQCNETFSCTTRFHVRTVHQGTVQVLYSDGIIAVLERHPTGGIFTCSCGGFSSQDPQAIRRHTSKHPSTQLPGE